MVCLKFGLIFVLGWIKTQISTTESMSLQVNKFAPIVWARHSTQCRQGS